MNLQAIRGRINDIDREVLSLLAERMELALRTAKLKTEIRDKAREAWVLDQAARYSRTHGQLVDGDFVLSLFGDIIRESRRLQEKRAPLIGFQGEHGAFGELAARRYDSGLVPVPCVDFEDVFVGVEKGWLDYGIVPVEPSADGAVTAANDLIRERRLSVTGAVKLRLKHCLLALPGVRLEDIRTVFSHPLALARCRNFLEQHGLEARPYHDTAGAARLLIREMPGQAAAIGSEFCAGWLGLDVIQDRIEDRACESSRFLVLAREPGSAAGDRCALVFSAPRGGDPIPEVRDIFSRAGMALTRAESLPCPKRPEARLMLLQLQERAAGTLVEAAGEQFRRETGTFRLLGFYDEEVSE